VRLIRLHENDFISDIAKVVREEEADAMHPDEGHDQDTEQTEIFGT